MSCYYYIVIFILLFVFLSTYFIIALLLIKPCSSFVFFFQFFSFCFLSFSLLTSSLSFIFEFLIDLAHYLHNGFNVAGESPSSKRSVCEPTHVRQRFQQLVRNQTRVIIIVCVTAALLILIALIATLAQPSDTSYTAPEEQACKGVTPAPEEDKANDGLATNGEVFPWKDIRLPEHIQPLEYDLFLHPDLDTFTFTGQVDITLKTKGDKDFIVFHMKHMNYSAVVIRDQGNSRLQNVKILEYAKYEQVYIQTNKKLLKGMAYTLSIKFRAELSDSLAGFYKSSYMTKSDEKR